MKLKTMADKRKAYKKILTRISSEALSRKGFPTFSSFPESALVIIKIFHEMT